MSFLCYSTQKLYNNMKIESLINFIHDNLNWRELLSSEPYCLKIKQDPNNEYRFILTYDMIKSDMSLPIVQVCRGILLHVEEKAIFDQGKDYRVEPIEKKNAVAIIARGFDKFFNLGETNAAQLDWKNTFAWEKLDGSFIKYRNLPHYDGIKHTYTEMWMTNNGFSADSELPSTDYLGEFETFQDVINDALIGHDMKALREAGKLTTLFFELTSNYNRVVVKYDSGPKLWFLGGRNMESQSEISPEILTEHYKLDFDIPKKYDLGEGTSQQEIAEKLVSEMDSNHEGLVICDYLFNRVKMKSEQYLSIHRMKDANGQLSAPHLLKCIQAGTIDDILGIFPERGPEIHHVINIWNSVEDKLNLKIKVARLNTISASERWGTDDPKELKKQYALQFKDDPFSKVFFEIWKDQNNYEKIKEDFMANLDYDRLVQLNG